MKHLAEVMRELLLQQLENVRENYEKKKIDKTEFERIVNSILDKINEIDKQLKK